MGVRGIFLKHNLQRRICTDDETCSCIGTSGKSLDSPFVCALFCFDDASTRLGLCFCAGMGRRANGSAWELAVSATMVWRQWNNGKPVTVARVESLRTCESFAKHSRSWRPPRCDRTVLHRLLERGGPRRVLLMRWSSWENVEIFEIQAARGTRSNRQNLWRTRRRPGASCATHDPVEQVLPVAQVQVVERTVEKTVEIIQVTVHCSGRTSWSMNILL